MLERILELIVCNDFNQKWLLEIIPGLSLERKSGFTFIFSLLLTLKKGVVTSCCIYFRINGDSIRDVFTTSVIQI